MTSPRSIENVAINAGNSRQVEVQTSTEASWFVPCFWNLKLDGGWCWWLIALKSQEWSKIYSIHDLLLSSSSWVVVVQRNRVTWLRVRQLVLLMKRKAIASVSSAVICAGLSLLWQHSIWSMRSVYLCSPWQWLTKISLQCSDPVPGAASFHGSWWMYVLQAFFLVLRMATTVGSVLVVEQEVRSSRLTVRTPLSLNINPTTKTQMLCSAIGLFGAITFSVWMVAVGALWYIVELVLILIPSVTLLEFNMFAVLCSVIFYIYPHVSLVHQMMDGTMSEENYDTEKQSCCCV